MKPTRPIQIIFESLPCEFSRKDVEKLLKRHHRTMPVLEVIFRFKVQGFIRNSSHGRYFKLPNYSTSKNV